MLRNKKEIEAEAGDQDFKAGLEYMKLCLKSKQATTKTSAESTEILIMIYSFSYVR